jgi:hypothetical protein
MRGSAAFRTGAAPGGALAGPWVRDPLWTRARAVPSLDLRFADNKSLVDAVTGASLVTFTRASSGTFVDSAGVIQTAATNVPRFDHNPTTGESLGLLVEEQRTNLLLNSATLSTQLVTVAAAANTLSFYGTGTVTLTGVSTAGPLVGTGANDRVSLTFTPIVGVLVLTVSGSVTNAQLEAGAFPTSYIPTTTATVTRSADVASISGSNFSSWYRQDEGTMLAGRVFHQMPLAEFKLLYDLSDGTIGNERHAGLWSATNQGYAGTVTAGLGVNTSLTGMPAILAGQTAAIAQAWNSAISVAATKGIVSIAASTAGPQSINQMVLRSRIGGTLGFSGTIGRLTFWPQRLPNSTLQTLTQ